MPLDSELAPAPDAAFQAYLRAGEIRMQQCEACARFIFFPRTICPHCGGGSLAWKAVSGDGIIYSATTTRQKPERGGDYAIVLVDLAEGVRMMSRVIGINASNVRIGMPVRAVIEEAGDGPCAVVFKPAEQEAMQ
jgi:uncharacterized OB-fold protein